VFTADNIEARVRGRIFVPLRIVTSSGETYDVYHPNLIMVGRREVVIGRPASGSSTHYEQLTRIAIMHITALEDLPMGAPPSGNGQQTS
jgi:hypothetical protein